MEAEWNSPSCRWLSQITFVRVPPPAQRQQRRRSDGELPACPDCGGLLLPGGAVGERRAGAGAGIHLRGCLPLLDLHDGADGRILMDP